MSTSHAQGLVPLVEALQGAFKEMGWDVSGTDAWYASGYGEAAILVDLTVLAQRIADKVEVSKP